MGGRICTGGSEGRGTREMRKYSRHRNAVLGCTEGPPRRDVFGGWIGVRLCVCRSGGEVSQGLRRQVCGLFADAIFYNVGYKRVKWLGSRKWVGRAGGDEVVRLSPCTSYSLPLPSKHTHPSTPQPQPPSLEINTFLSLRTASVHHSCTAPSSTPPCSSLPTVHPPRF